VSIPSGHSSGTFATATVLQRRYGWKVGIPAYRFAAYVAASRLSENKHLLSDVILGAAIGIMGGRTVTVGRGPVCFAISPMIPPGGGVGIRRLCCLGIRSRWVREVRPIVQRDQTRLRRKALHGRRTLPYGRQRRATAHHESAGPRAFVCRD